jgi:hypothetical protein
VGNRSHKCAICSSSRQLREAVEQLIDGGATLDEVAAQTQFSRSTLSRHQRGCRLRQVLNQHRTPPRDARILTRWPDNSLTVQFDPADPQGRNAGQPVEPSEVQPTDIVVGITFRQSAILNPIGLSARLTRAEGPGNFFFCTFDPLPEALPPAPEPSPRVDPPSETPVDRLPGAKNGQS